jgi:hypothetical protein
MFVCACWFRKTEGGKIYEGVAIGRHEGDIHTIVDKKTCRPIPRKPWSMDLAPHAGCFDTWIPRKD